MQTIRICKSVKYTYSKGMDTCDTLLKKHHLKTTHARKYFADIFLQGHKPYAVAELVHAARKESIDLSTIYRTLDTFESAGIIRSVRGNGKSIMYEYVSAHTHHHLVCTKCDEVEEVKFDSQSLQKKVLASSKKFTALDTGTIELFGVCVACKK